MAKKEETPVTVPIETYFPDDLQTKYSTHMAVQHTQHEFTIFFFEAHPFPVVGTPKEIKETLEKMTISGECVARIVVAKDRMPDFVKALQKNLKNFNQKYNKEKK